MLDYFSIIHKYIPSNSETYKYYVPHVVLVTQKALAIAKKLQLSPESLQFIEEAAMLHDIGIIKVDAKDIGCTGELPYLCHGTEGRKMLEEEGLPKHALVCERHTGVGITKQEIIENNLPLPPRDMIPLSVEERIICYADVYFSKNPQKLWIPYTQDEIKDWFYKFGPVGKEKHQIFLEWRQEFGEQL